MTPAQKRVARHVLGMPSSGRGATSQRNVATIYDDTLHGLVAMELVEAGKASAVKLAGGRHDYRLTAEAAAEALEPGEKLSLRDFPPPGVIVGGHPSEFF